MRRTYLGPDSAGRLARAFLLVTFYFLSAASAFAGFYGKWGLREGHLRNSLPLMVDGGAQRPFVYRQLFPLIANAVDAAIPPALKARIVSDLVLPQRHDPTITRTGLRRTDAGNPAYALRYHVVYYLSFASLFLALFAMRQVALWSGLDGPAALLAPPAFALGLPVLLSVGGYFYDLGEVLFLFLALACAMSWRGLLPPLAVVATLNKESFLFYLATLLPLVVRHRRDWRGAAVLGAAGLASGLTYLAVNRHFAANPGGMVEFHLFQNLLYYLNPWHVFRIEVTYGVVMFAGYSLVTLALVGVFIWLGRGCLSPPLRRHAALALVVNLVLLMLFCYPAETRNLSLLYPTLLLLIAGTLQSLWPAITRSAASGTR